jgi:uncharacterized repeat protein (TIGR01451 family)
VTAEERRVGGAVVLAIVFTFAGVFAGRPSLLVAAAVPLVYVTVGSLSSAPDPAALTVTREITPTPAPPGRPVAVTLTVENDGDASISDVRVVDGVPDGLAVSGGSPRGGTGLKPGESLTVRYALVARRGDFVFDPPRLTVRGLGAGAARTTRPAVDGDTRFSGRLDAEAPPVDAADDGRVGQLETAEPGEGVSFHSTREYEHGDPAGRIDWRHYAKGGSLTTVEYDKRVTATVVLVLDARRPSRVVAGPGRPTAVELSAYAATQSMTDLLATGHEVGVAVVGLDGPNAAGLHWLPPGTGSAQRARALSLFELACDADPAAAEGYVDPQAQCRRLLELAPRDAQLALLSPMIDDLPEEAATDWASAGRSVTVLSPDVVTRSTIGGEQSHIRRRTRLTRCQRAGVRPIDWRRGTPLAVVIELAFAVDAKVSADRMAAGTGGVS